MNENWMRTGEESSLDDPQIIAPTNPGGILPADEPGGESPTPIPMPEAPDDPAPEAPDDAPDNAPDAPAAPGQLPAPQAPGDEEQTPADEEQATDEEEQASDEEQPPAPGEELGSMEQLLGGLPTQSEPSGIPWLGIGIAGGVVLALLVALICILTHRKRRRPKPIPSTVNLGGVPRPGPCIHVGKLHEQGARPGQQDCFSVSPDELTPTHGLLAVVADGMGGLTDGDKVSQTAVTAFMNGFYTVQGEPQQTLLALLEQANQAVNDLLGPEGLRKSGSTLVAGLIRNGGFYYVSVGDSRICLYRDGALRQLNREHIYRNELNLRAVNGEESFQTAASDPTGGGLTSFLGMGRLAHIDVPAEPETIRPGDKFILMSDGVYNALPAMELTQALALDAPQAAEAIRAAIQAKGYANQDNYTAVILACDGIA